MKIRYLLIAAGACFYLGAAQPDDKLLPKLVAVGAKTLVDALNAPNAFDYATILARRPYLRVRSIDIAGNARTRSDIVASVLDIKPGDRLTVEKIKTSERRVEALKCFEQGGVLFELRNIQDNRVDVLVWLSEASPGNFRPYVEGPAPRRDEHYPVGGVLTYTNLLGCADQLEVRGGTPGASSGICEFSYHVPSIAASGIGAGFDVYYRESKYLRWLFSYAYPHERQMGGSVHMDIPAFGFDRDVVLHGEVGAEVGFLANEEALLAARKGLTRFDPSFLISNKHPEFMFDRVARQGPLGWVALSLRRDTCNHPVSPSEGTRLQVTSKLGLPGLDMSDCYLKHEALGCLYIPLVGTDTLVLALRVQGGTIQDISGSGNIPRREFFVIGSDDTIRGAAPGLTGPVLMSGMQQKESFGSPIGANHHAVCSLEVRAPIPVFHSLDLRCRVFYDVGCGWGVDMKDVPQNARPYLKNIEFKPRQVAGVGLSGGKFLLWNTTLGYKLDRTESFEESPWMLYGSVGASW